MRIRHLFVGVLGAAIVVIAVAAGWAWMQTLVTRSPAPSADPATTVTRYLDAWAAGDHLGMIEVVRDPPEDFVARHAQLRDGLQIRRLELVAGAIDEEVDGRVRVPVTVLADVDYSREPLTWQVDLSVVRERGQWQVWWSLAAIHPQLRDGWAFDVESEPVDRAPILAADGTQLAGQGSRVSFGFEPSLVTDTDALVEAFEAAVPGSGRVARREVERDNLRDGWYYPVATVSAARDQAAWSRLRGTPGVLRRAVEGRTLYDDNFAHHVVGVLAEATAEQLEELGDDGEPGMLVSQYGLERAVDDRLVGSDLVRAGLRDEAGGPLRVVIGETQANPSGPVHTTIDVAVQQAVEDALAGVTGDIGIVVVDGDGAIRGAASRPVGAYNRAFEGRYPPGSTFKIVTAEALLAAGHRPDEVLGCPPVTTVGGLRIANAGDLDGGSVTLTEAFARSCNTTFAALGAALGADALVDAAARFGFGIDPLTVLESFGGSFPRPADAAEAGAAAFGQGRVEASVLHLAGVAAAADTGVWRQPYLLVEDGPGEVVALTPGVHEHLRTMMRAVVVSGTGAQADVPGLEVRGKSGTAQAGGGIEHAWFVGTWGGYGFAVLVEGGGAGGQVAAPIAATLVHRLAELTGSVPPPLVDDGPPESGPDDTPDDGPDDDPAGESAEDPDNDG